MDDDDCNLGPECTRHKIQKATMVCLAPKSTHVDVCTYYQLFQETMMSPEFKEAFADTQFIEWLTWLGQPLLYDGDLCVTRTKEEIDERNKHSHAELCLTS